MGFVVNVFILMKIFIKLAILVIRLKATENS